MIPLHRITVLVVDDSPSVHTALRRLLEKDPRFELVGEAMNGREGVEREHTLNPDVVVMDIQMPELDGIEATAAILLNNPRARVLMHSSLGDSATIQLAMETGAVGYVRKQDAANALGNAIEAVWNRRAA